MADYKEAGLTGTQWQRCKTVVINNPLVGKKGVTFEEERVIALDGQSLRQPVGGCSKPFGVDGSFPLLDPNDNMPLGQSMTHTELYVALYSLYMQTALERDAAAV
jgi:hypothetical protein